MKDILIIDDEKVICSALSKIFQSEKLSLLEAYDAETGLQLLDKENFKLIITDIMLPAISGFELIKLIRKKNLKLPVIVISGYANLDNALKAFKYGAFDFIPKPFDMDEIMGVVLRALTFHDRFMGKEDYFLNNIQKSEKNSQTYFLGYHSWVQLEDDGTALIGAGETFRNLVGEVLKIETVSTENFIKQGSVCLNIHNKGNYLHKVWAPLSGNLIKQNPILEQSTSLRELNPFRDWLLKIIPENPKEELQNLAKDLTIKG